MCSTIVLTQKPGNVCRLMTTYGCLSTDENLWLFTCFEINQTIGLNAAIINCYNLGWTGCDIDIGCTCRTG